MTRKGAITPDEAHDWERGPLDQPAVMWCESCAAEYLTDDDVCPVCGAELERL